MLARHRSAILLSLSLAAALTLSGIAAELAMSRPGLASVSVADLPPLRRSVVWYGVPEFAPKSLHIESSSVNASSPDEFQITYSAGNFTLVYQRVAGGPITNQYTLSVQGLVEWNDTSGDGHIEDGTVVDYTPFGPSSFGRFPIQHTERTTANGIGVNSFLISSNRGDIFLNLTIADGFIALPTGQTLTPMEAKLNLEINHNMTLPGTRLSLQVGMSTDQKVVLENESWDDLNHFSTDDRAVNVTNEAGPNPSSAYFAWSNSASVNGQVGVVIPSGPTANATVPGQYDLYFSYPRPAAGGLNLRIVHDPTIGVVSAAFLGGPRPESPLPFQSDAFLYAISLAGIAALLVGTAFLVNRRRQKGA